MCKHLKQWTDEFGDRLSQCELWPEYKPEDCPLSNCCVITQELLKTIDVLVDVLSQEKSRN